MSDCIQGHGYIDEDGDTLLFWKVETLWRLSETLSVQHLALDEIYWADDNCAYLEEDDTYLNFAKHVKRVLDADLSFPVILSPKGIVMDGMHRLVKASIFGVPVVKVVRFSEMPPPDCAEPRPAKAAEDRA